jgi:hypothetical protein
VRVVVRVLNILVALATLGSAIAVLVSDLTIPDYRAHYRDAVWFVTAYAAVQLVYLIEFARDGRLVPWLALTRTAAAYGFLAFFLELWPTWRWWTPGRYVYQLFEWGEPSKLGLFALVFLGRGAGNTLNAFYLTERWWRPLRMRRPLLGRAVTAVPVAATVLSVAAFLQLVHEEGRNFSAEAQDVASFVYHGLDCTAVRAHAGTTTTDLRQRGDRHYRVEIAYGCTETRVIVRDEDGRIGTAGGPQLDCCRDGT